MLRATFAALFLVMLVNQTPAAAQEQSDADADASAAARIAEARATYLPAPRQRSTCNKDADSTEIVVCAPDRGEDQRVPSSADSDPRSRSALRTGMPSAPNVSGLPDCSSGCIGMGWAPPPVYYIDVKALPQAPEGSDAEKVAKGEMPDR